MTDFTRLLGRLDPKPDGESPVRHRTAIVDAVNTDGTLDLDLSGVIVPGVATMHAAPVGAVVQVLAWKGDLLSLGTAGATGALGYEEITASQSGLGATLTNITGLSVAVNVPAGRRVKVTVYVSGLASTVAGDRGVVSIREGASGLQYMLHDYRTTDTRDGAIVIWIGTPTAGSHTYRASYQRNAGSGSHTWSAEAIAPSFILVEDIGAA